MKSKRIAEVTPHIMDDHLILSLDIDWIKEFNGVVPKFEVEIDQERRLVIRSPVISRGVQV